jgi:hypothetical protein
MFNRTHIIYVSGPLFPATNKKKFRGTHLKDDEDFQDSVTDSASFPSLAWSFLSSGKRAEENEKMFATNLRANSNNSSSTGTSSAVVTTD